ncbi:MAG: hypothetical protein KatS3mg115_1021 [Candidatus Poribacteria bacterium]|nr:MAG: hypothetical protein KatS3mg115_1021 [Candidatus Poribacteria bacterium]
MDCVRVSWIGAVLLGVVLLGGAGCSEEEPIEESGGILSGEEGNLLGATLTSWARVDENGAVTEIGFRLPMAAVEAAPVAEFDPTTPPGEEIVLHLEVPELVQQTTLINFIEVGYNPAGHPPMGVYTVPHFDFHYYSVPEAEVAAIDCSDMTPFPEEMLPENHVADPPGPPPDGGCVPGMGIHAVDSTSPELHPESPAPFTETMILGAYGGKFLFIEPMIARDVLLERGDFSMEIPVPATVGRNTLYPTRFLATYDAQEDAYTFLLVNFVPVN